MGLLSGWRAATLYSSMLLVAGCTAPAPSAPTAAPPVAAAPTPAVAATTVPPAAQPTTASAAVPQATAAPVVASRASGTSQRLADQTLRFADQSSGLRGGLDPISAQASPELWIIREIYNGLLRFQPGNAGVIEPDLAERWETSSDGTTMTFHLRSGVQFHQNFGELTADDVKFSLDRARDKNQSTWASEFTNLKSVNVIDPHTVQLQLEKPDAFALQMVANVRAGLIVSKKAADQYGDQFKNNPVGTGPFAFDSMTPGKQLTLVANPTYFRGTPILQKFVISFIPDANARLLAYRNNEADAGLGEATEDWLSQVPPEVTVLPGAWGGRVLQFNLGIPPFDNVLVRRALAYAYNPDEVAQYIGQKIVATKVPSVLPKDWPEVKAAEGQATWYDYNPDKARQLLAQAGLPNGFSVRIAMTNQSDSLDTMQIIQAQWKKVGVDLQMDVIEHAAYRKITDALQNALGIIGPRRDNADLQLRTYYHSEAKGAYNWSGYGILTPGVDSLIDEARTTLDADKRNAIYAKIQKQVMEDLPLIPIYQIDSTPMVLRPQVDLGYQVTTSPPGTYIYDITEQSSLVQR
jgi:peptide/nickel transport system substrate-binding protein